MATDVKFKELEDALSLVLNHLRKSGLESVVIDEVGYLHLRHEDVLSVYSTPRICLAQYEEDVDTIRNELDSIGTISFNYIHALSALIQYIAISQELANHIRNPTPP